MVLIGFESGHTLKLVLESAWPLGVAPNNGSWPNARKVTRSLSTNVHSGDARHPR